MSSTMITGGSGFIGSHFQNYLRPFEVVNLDLRHPDFKSNAAFVQGDVRKIEDLENTLEAHECESIIHLAAEHKDFGIKDDQFNQTNIEGTRNICRAASNFGIRKIIFLLHRCGLWQYH